ncbi:MAG: hypothetical protein IJM59_13995 [Proteobacteria bacterium]|jgi:hypothetical protein|nr:hypothetical protein [Pseudomonadota bacterium]
MGNLENTQARKEPITFTGRTRSDAKRKALNYWYMNQTTLAMSIREFSARLVLLPDGKSIVFYENPVA